MGQLFPVVRGCARCEPRKRRRRGRYTGPTARCQGAAHNLSHLSFVFSFFNKCGGHMMARPPMCLLVALLAGLAPAAATAAPRRALQAATACPCEVCVGKHNSVADCESFGLDCSSTAGTRPPSRAASSKSSTHIDSKARRTIQAAGQYTQCRGLTNGNWRPTVRWIQGFTASAHVVTTSDRLVRLPSAQKRSNWLAGWADGCWRSAMTRGISE
jgi:hypothetical protein